MFAGATEGATQGQMQRMLFDRQDRLDALREQQMNLQRDQMTQDNEVKRAGAVKGFIQGAADFFKMTGDKNATIRFWNQNAQKYGLGQISDLAPTEEPDKWQVHTVEGQAYFVRMPKAQGQAPEIVSANIPKSPKRQFEDVSAGYKTDKILTGTKEEAEAAAGIQAPSSDRKQTTPEQAMKRKLAVLESLYKLEKGGVDPAMAAIAKSFDPAFNPQAGLDPALKQRITEQAEAEIAQMDAIIKGGSAGAEGGSLEVSLVGKPAGRYRAGGRIIKWDGTKVIE
jgi:hypothetical protein